MTQRIVVDRPPVASEECGYQKDQGALRLVEIGHQHVDDAETETRNYDDTGIGLQLVETVFVKVLHDGLEGFVKRIGIVAGIRAPLLDSRGPTGIDTRHTKIVKRLQSTDGSGPDRDNSLVSPNE